VNNGRRFIINKSCTLETDRHYSSSKEVVNSKILWFTCAMSSNWAGCWSCCYAACEDVVVSSTVSMSTSVAASYQRRTCLCVVWLHALHTSHRPASLT